MRDMISLTHLSSREAEVIGLFATGFSTRDIARKLFLSPKTIATHRARVKIKMQITSGVEWMRLLRRFPVPA